MQESENRCCQRTGGKFQRWGLCKCPETTYFTPKLDDLQCLTEVVGFQKGVYEIASKRPFFTPKLDDLQ